MAPEFVFDGFSTTAIIGSLVLAGFSIAVGFLAKFRGPAVHYVLFGAGFGIGAALGHFRAALVRAVGIGLNDEATPADFTPEMTTWAVWLGTFGWIALAAALIGVIGLIRSYDGWNPRLMLAGAAIGSLQAALSLILDGNSLGVWPIGQAMTQFMQLWVLMLLAGILAMGSVAMAFAYVRDGRVNQALLGVALAAYPILNGMWTFVGTKIGGAPSAWFIWAPPVFTVLIIAAWAWAFKRTRSPAARNVLLFAIASTVLALAMSPFPQVLHMGGLARTIDVFIVAYAILRHQYLDLDVKLRWTISKTTLAGMFVAVFFMVSEGAAALFSEQWGTGIGIAAAGLLVFGIAPLMRIADKFAATAVPVQSNPEQIFAAAVRAALADGHISAKEEAHLAEVAEGLGLTPTRMTAIRAREAPR